MYTETMSVILVTYFTMMHIVIGKATLNESLVMRNSEEDEIFDIDTKL